LPNQIDYENGSVKVNGFYAYQYEYGERGHVTISNTNILVITFIFTFS